MRSGWHLNHCLFDSPPLPDGEMQLSEEGGRWGLISVKKILRKPTAGLGLQLSSGVLTCCEGGPGLHPNIPHAQKPNAVYHQAWSPATPEAEAEES